MIVDRPGPPLRTDVVDVYVFRRAPRTSGSPELEFLALLRAQQPLARTWQPVMGHIHAGETAPRCALRELAEETGLAPADPACLGVWALDRVRPVFLPHSNEILLSPSFAAETNPDWEPRLDAEHAAFRWVCLEDAPRAFTWPGQAEACREIALYIAREDAPARDHLRIA